MKPLPDTTPTQLLSPIENTLIFALRPRPAGARRKTELMQTANRRLDGGANDPRRIVRGGFVRIEAGEIDCIAVGRER